MRFYTKARLFTINPKMDLLNFQDKELSCSNIKSKYGN